ncbi:MAG TPA: hypothetical protein PLQ63_09875 [Propionicimonas sp.]|nr:hypothetical protein [Propionicimonas sp.]
MAEAPQTPHRRARVAIPAVIAGGVSALLLAFSMTPTFAQLTAAIANSTNNAGTGTLIMEEKNAAGTVTCLSTDGGSVITNSATCATINKYGGDLAMVSGETVTTTITIKNVGTAPAAAFSLTPSPCTQSGGVTGSATDLCTKTTVTITGTGTAGAKPVYSGTALALGTGGAIDVLAKLLQAQATIEPGATVSFTIAVKTGASTTDLGNTYQGLKISQPLSWTFTA